MKKLVYKIGADPEVFIEEIPTGRIISAHNLVDGSKESPWKVPGGAIQPDGTSAEFNVYPCLNARQFSTTIKDVLTELDRTVLRKFAVTPGQFKGPVRLKVIPTARFDIAYFNSLPAKAKALGCHPDWSAWTETENPPPDPTLSFRTGAGHIHIGWSQNEEPFDDAHFNDCLVATKQMDALLFFSSMLWDDDQDRRRLYGKIGAFRPKKYGVEYRSLSNAWVADPRLHEFVFNTAVFGMHLLDEADRLVWNHHWTKSFINRALNNVYPTRAELIPWHQTMVNDFGVPKLPDDYLTLGFKGV